MTSFYKYFHEGGIGYFHYEKFKYKHTHAQRRRGSCALRHSSVGAPSLSLRVVAVSTTDTSIQYLPTPQDNAYFYKALMYTN